MFMNIYLIFLILTNILCFYIFIRTDLVYNYRVELLYSDRNKYLLLPSYNEMMYKFWIWDFDKFLPENIEE